MSIPNELVKVIVTQPVQKVSLKISDGIGDKNYVHTQTSASSVWTVVHGLNKFSSVSVSDSGGNVVYGDIDYIDLDTVTITFTSSFSGRAYFN